MQSFILARTIFKLGILFSPSSWMSLLDIVCGGRYSRSYLEKQGLTQYLPSGSVREIPVVPRDLVRLHKLILSRKPAVALEFGVGFSTIVIAHALVTNGGGHLYTVDASEQWIENTRQKLNGKLGNHVTFLHSPVEAEVHEGQLVANYKKLPNIVPEFIYLDGPSPFDVKGNVKGLQFSIGETSYRPMVAADILLYESSLLTGAYVLVDRRYANVQFLKNNLKRKWKIHWDRVQHQVGFELRDITSRAKNHSARMIRKPAQGRQLSETDTLWPQT